MPRTGVAIVSFLSACALTSACSKSDNAGRVALGTSAPAASPARSDASGPKLPLAAMAALDAGNAAYRSKQFSAAIVKYREAAAAAPEHAAPWFGLYMAANETKNSALADSAMQRVKALSADPASLSAHAEVASPSVIPSTPSMPADHPTTATPLPSGHPSAAPLPPGHPAPIGPTAPALPRKPMDSNKRGRV
jgi:hypothetical protein